MDKYVKMRIRGFTFCYGCNEFVPDKDFDLTRNICNICVKEVEENRQREDDIQEDLNDGTIIK